MKGWEEDETPVRSWPGEPNGYPGEQNGYPALPPVLTKVEERRLCRLARQDPAAFNQVFEANIRLVIAIAQRYRGRSMTLMDLCQEGMIGLARAVREYDPDKGFKFSTYATYWIRCHIMRAIDQNDRMIRLPTYGCNIERRVERATERLKRTLGREPTAEEIAHDTRLSRRLVTALAQIGPEPLSLDTLIGGRMGADSAPFIDFVPDDRTVDPAELAMQRLELREIYEEMERLDPDEREVLERHYGLNGYRPHTFLEVGLAVGMSKEGARFKAARAKEKIRQSLARAGRR